MKLVKLIGLLFFVVSCGTTKNNSRQILESQTKDIQFKSGSATLTSNYTETFDYMLGFMSTKPKTTVFEIAAHTDNTGNRLANLNLSKQRAEAIKAVLVKRGIDADQLKAVGHGAKNPIVSNRSIEGRIKNNRITISIVN